MMEQPKPKAEPERITIEDDEGDGFASSPAALLEQHAPKRQKLTMDEVKRPAQLQERRDLMNMAPATQSKNHRNRPPWEVDVDRPVRPQPSRPPLEDWEKQAEYEASIIRKAAERAAMEFERDRERERKGATTNPFIGETVAKELSAEQRHVLDLVRRGKNVFFTGAAGTGKSFLLRRIISELRALHTSDRVAVTASTGLAALNIGGQTLHSWTKLGLMKGSKESMLASVMKRRKSQNTNWTNTQVLVVDEISMVPASMLEAIDYIARNYRGRTETPFGGIQLVLCGDFFQLPPVPSRDMPRPQRAFEHPLWDEALDCQVLLHKVFRQNGDPRLIELLEALRHGRLTKEQELAFKKMSRNIDYGDGLEPTHLFPLRRDVDNYNRDKLSKIQSRQFTYIAKDSGKNEFELSKLENLMADAKLQLKVGAQVMLITNMRDTDPCLVNGTRGAVVSFVPYLLEIEFHGLYRTGDIKHWNAALECRGNDSLPYESRRVLEDYFGAEDFPKMMSCAAHDTGLLPLVDFKDCGLYCLKEQEFTVESHEIDKNGKPKVLATRLQLPYILSYALSVHKAQGQTIDRLRVNLGQVFETGQAYVAISRATHSDRLQIIKFRSDVVKTDPVVVDFYKKLERVQDPDAGTEQ